MPPAEGYKKKKNNNNKQQQRPFAHAPLVVVVALGLQTSGCRPRVVMKRRKEARAPRKNTHGWTCWPWPAATLCVIGGA